jgi:hypothetical protein
MKRTLVLAAVIVFAGVALAFAQDHVAATNGDRTSFSGAPRVSDLATASKALGFRLLDPSRLRMHQSYSLSYFSGSGVSGSVGLYMNTLEYDLFKPLTVRVGLAYMHSPFGISDRSGGTVLDENRILPSFGLDYHPSDKFFLSIDYRTMPSSGWPYGGGGFFRADSRWGLLDPWRW